MPHKNNKKFLQNAIAATPNSEKGTVVVSVLVAMVFIGVVVGSMVKSTNSQASLTRGFAVSREMSQALASGIVASETHFSSVPREQILDKLTAIVQTPGNHQYLYGNSGKKTRVGDDGPYFSSKIYKFDSDKNHAWFEIEGGRNENGKTLKNVNAYYHVDNVKNGTTAGKFGNNAILANVQLTGNQQMIIEGYATFGKKAMNIFNSTATDVLFAKDENGKGDVFFEGPVTFNQSNNLKFETKAYFNDQVVIQNLPSGKVFEDDVVFRTNVSAGKDVRFDGDVYIGGAIKDAYGNAALQASIKADGNAGTNQTFYHTDNLGLPPAGSTCVANGNICPVCKIQHVSTSAGSKYSVSGFNDVQKMASFDSAGILNNLGINHLTDRQEPDLNMDIAGKQYLDLTDVVSRATGGKSTNNIEPRQLETFIATSRGNPAYAKYFHNGHLLINVNTTINFHDRTHRFNEKVIFNVDRTFNISSTGPGLGSSKNGGDFYESGPNGSTMIYVGPNGRLDNFGCNDYFRGLIYMDKNNKENHTMKFTENSRIEGAMLLKGSGTLSWNNGNHRVRIKRDDDVLKNFAGLIDGATNGDPVIVADDENRPISLTPYGFFFR